MHIKIKILSHRQQAQPTTHRPRKRKKLPLFLCLQAHVSVSRRCFEDPPESEDAPTEIWTAALIPAQGSSYIANDRACVVVYWDLAPLQVPPDSNF